MTTKSYKIELEKNKNNCKKIVAITKKIDKDDDIITSEKIELTQLAMSLLN